LVLGHISYVNSGMNDRKYPHYFLLLCTKGVGMKPTLPSAVWLLPYF